MADEDAEGRVPTVSVIVCTRNRNDNAEKLVEAILASEYRSLELLLMDQSDTEATRRAVQHFAALDPRFCYQHLGYPGKPAALNAAAALARGRYLLLTDDDCEPQPGWIEAMLSGFADERIGCIFGAVDPAPHDSKTGYIFFDAISSSATITRVKDASRISGRVTLGMGANLAIRRTALDTVHGWDPCIGPGARFRSGDDHDVATRINLAGYHIGFCAEGRVTHFGFRTWAQRFNDPARFGYGRGAATAKYLRCGIVNQDALHLFWYHVYAGLRDPRHGIRKQPSWAFVREFFPGFAAGMRHPVQKDGWRFLPVQETERGKYGGEFAQVVLRSELEALDRQRLK